MRKILISFMFIAVISLSLSGCGLESESNDDGVYGRDDLQKEMQKASSEMNSILKSNRE